LIPINYQPINHKREQRFAVGLDRPLPASVRFGGRGATTGCAGSGTTGDGLGSTHSGQSRFPKALLNEANQAS
jgi:hypothetical protein